MPIKQWSNITPDFSNSSRTNAGVTAGLSQASTIFSELAKSIEADKQRAFDNSLASERLKIAQEDFKLRQRESDNADTTFKQTQSDREDEITSYSIIDSAFKKARDNKGIIDYNEFNKQLDIGRSKIKNAKVFSKSVNSYLNDANKTEESKNALNQYSLLNNANNILKEFNSTNKTSDPEYGSKLVATLMEAGFNAENANKLAQTAFSGTEEDRKAIMQKAILEQTKVATANARASTALTIANLEAKKKLEKEKQITSEIIKELAPQLSAIPDMTTKNQLIANALIKRGISIDNLPQYNKQMGFAEFNALVDNRNKQLKAGAKTGEQAIKNNKAYGDKLDNLYKESGISGNLMSDVDNKIKFNALINTLKDRYPNDYEKVYKFMTSTNFADDFNIFDGINDTKVKKYTDPNSKESMLLDEYITGKKSVKKTKNSTKNSNSSSKSRVYIPFNER